MPTAPKTHRPLETLKRHRSPRRRRPVGRPRMKTAARGYGGQWQVQSKLFLRENPLCRECLAEGKAVAADCVDHVRPHRGDMTLFWDEANWQALCNPCHSRKTQRGE